MKRGIMKRFVSHSRINDSQGHLLNFGANRTVRVTLNGNLWKFSIRLGRIIYVAVGEKKL